MSLPRPGAEPSCRDFGWLKPSLQPMIVYHRRVMSAALARPRHLRKSPLCQTYYFALVSELQPQMHQEGSKGMVNPCKMQRVD